LKTARGLAMMMQAQTACMECDSDDGRYGKICRTNTFG
jgi:hypothetical protein